MTSLSLKRCRACATCRFLQPRSRSDRRKAGRTASGGSAGTRRSSQRDPLECICRRKALSTVVAAGCGRDSGAPGAELLATACALEMIHTYSLIHDDLPSMDNDDLRRGRPTCHVRFGEATAILAGDALQSLAFQTIAEDESLDASQRLKLIAELGRAAGTPHGMVAGQALDLEAESRDVSGMEMEQSHSLKTGALIIAAARCGAFIANADDVQLNLITRYAAQLGLLFQITDDLLDVTSTAETLGKTPGKDARSRKATFPGIYGIESTRERARRCASRSARRARRIKPPRGSAARDREFHS